MKKDEISSIDALIEKPIDFTIEGRAFSIAPSKMGKAMIMSRYFLLMDIDEEAIKRSPIKEAARIISQHADDVIRYMSLAVCNTREELTDEAHLKELDEFFRWNSDPTTFADIVKIVITQSDYANFIAATRLMQIYRLGISTAKEEDRVAQ